jgi:hypothetical protein
MSTLPRREFLLHALAACGTPLFVSVPALGASQAGGQGSNAGRSATVAARYFGGSAAAARGIGEEYLRSVGAENTLASILDVTRNALKSLESGSTPQAAITALVRAVRADFQSGRTLELQGWVLSRTEVELCALTLLPTVK